MSQNTKLMPGQLVSLTQGEYSDFGIVDIVVVRKECDLKELREEFLKQHEPKHQWDTGDPSAFVAWMAREEYVASASYSEIHLGGYGRIEF
jgi:hypothetical protein